MAIDAKNFKIDKSIFKSTLAGTIPAPMVGKHTTYAQSFTDIAGKMAWDIRLLISSVENPKFYTNSGFHRSIFKN